MRGYAQVPRFGSYIGHGSVIRKLGGRSRRSDISAHLEGSKQESIIVFISPLFFPQLNIYLGA